MAKKQSKNKSGKNSVGVRKNYNLKSDAVETLADPDAHKDKVYSREELDKYRSKKGLRIPETVKILFIKAWFPGAVCFFILWGLGIYVNSMLDMLFILGVVLGIVTDLLTNNVIRFMEKTPGANDKWLLMTRKGMLTFFLHILYGLFIIVCVYMLYNLINLAIVSVTGRTDTIPLGVEPVLFGVFCMGIDMLFVTVKRTMQKILRDAKETARSSLR